MIGWNRAVWRGVGDVSMLILLVPVALAVVSLAVICGIGYFPVWWWRRGRKG